MEYAIGLAVIAAILCAYIWRRGAPTAAQLASADMLKAWVGNELIDLTDSQKEAINLFAQSHNQSWVKIGRDLTDYPNARKALDELQS